MADRHPIFVMAEEQRDRHVRQPSLIHRTDGFVDDEICECGVPWPCADREQAEATLALEGDAYCIRTRTGDVIRHYLEVPYPEDTTSGTGDG